VKAETKDEVLLDPYSLETKVFSVATKNVVKFFAVLMAQVSKKCIFYYIISIYSDDAW